jgi:tetratricopeptide (TPR) repeat protein
MMRALFIAFCVLLHADVRALAADAASEFEAANRLYEKGDYPGAVAAYGKLADTRQSSPALLFNLGNAYFKNGQIGRAIFAYRHAERLDPRDPDIRANLNFALSSVPGNAARMSNLDRALEMLTLNERGALTAVSLWICFGLMALAQFRPSWKSAVRTIVVCAAIFATFFGVWYAQGLIARATERKVVVTAPTATVRFGPLEESQVSFNVRDGNELQLLGRKDKWLQVADASNRSGWILAGDVAELP